MVALPGRCTRCGRASRGEGGILVDDDAMVQMSASDNVLGVCDRPGCGGAVLAIEGGDIRIQQGAIEVASGPQWSQDVVDELRLGLRRVLDQNPEDVDQALRDQVDTEIADDFARSTKGKNRKFKLAVVGAMWAALNLDYSNLSDNAEAAVNAAREVLRFVVEHGHLPGS